jgi:hypothetical protein
MAESKDAEAQPWVYEHPSDHPDNKPPVTVVAEDTEEAVKEYETKVNAELEKSRAKPEDTTPVLEPLKVQLVDPEKDREKAKEATDYEAHTVPELKEMAADKGISIPYDANKADIIKALKKGK